MNGAQAILESLKKENVEMIFGYPGGAVLTLYDELYKMKFKHILSKHEQGAVHAADGYARATGKVGVCFATSGPGATNLVTGIATAYMDSVPLVCITGQVANPYIGKDSFQEADVCGITTPITKHNYLVKSVQDLPRVLKEAFFIARTGRPGPVVIDVAKDVFAAQINFDYPKRVSLRGYKGEFIGQETELDAVMAALGKAKRPLLFIGGGVTLSDKAEDIKAIAKRLGVPVISTLMGLGCIAGSDEAFLGMAGMHGCYAANMAIMECDLLLGVGVRFDDRVTGTVDTFAPRAEIVHFEVDPAEINKNVPADYRVLGDLRWSLPLWRKKLEASTADYRERYSRWLRYTIEMAIEKPLCYDKEQKSCIMPQAVIEKASQLLDDDTIIVTDVGQHQIWAAQFYNSRQPRSFITSGGLGTMGYGLPAALGAKLGQSERKVVLFTGDGSIMMNCQEMATAADYGIDVKIIVLHNHMLGMVAQWQRMFYEGHYAESRLNGHTDLVKLAEAMGLRACRIDEPDRLEEVLQQELSKPGAVLIDIMVPENEDVLPMVPGGKSLAQMILGGAEE